MTERTQHAKVYSAGQVLYPDISYKAFVYPGDEEALAALKSIPGASQLLTYLQENFSEELIFLQNNQQMIRASYHNYASLYKLLERCCEILSLPVPELYLTTNPTLNAYTVGTRRTCIVLHSELIETMTLDELTFVIGHELGHIKCSHGLYRMLGDLLIRYWDLLSSVITVPGLGMLRVPMLLAYWEWFRRAELTCDRAGLMCVQDREVGLRALSKLAGKVAGYEDEFSTDAALKQAEAKKEVKNKLVLLVSILEAAQNTHPFVPTRLKHLAEFAEGDQYKKILAGEFEKDVLGLHESGARITCQCGLKVNAKLCFCPECGRELGVADAAAAAVGPAPEQPQESKLDKLKGTAGSFFKR
ncbi:MAG TPA: M48 family metallopeptidase [Bryobacteraceae bacterium]|nr:M48 family metallopeptidase [Bryobacteraceae bacterium]